MDRNLSSMQPIQSKLHPVPILVFKQGYPNSLQDLFALQVLTLLETGNAPGGAVVDIKVTPRNPPADPHPME